MDTFSYQRLSEDRFDRSPNCDIQEREIREYFEAQGDAIVGSFRDNDISISKEGRKSTRPREGYPDMLAAIEAHPRPCKIGITEMPRLYRDPEELISLFRLAEKAQLKRIETTDGMYYDLSTGLGIHNAIVAVSTAALESRRMSERLRRKRKALAEEGRPHGGNRAYGYEGALNDEKGVLLNPGRVGIAVVEHEAAIIRECVERLLAGWPLRSIVRDLNGRGVKTAGGGMWHPTQLRRVLISKHIVGIRVHLGQEYPAQWSAIITEEEHHRVCAVLQAAERFKGSSKKGSRSYLLTGLIYCGECGKPLVGSGGVYGARGHSGRRYRCKTVNAWGNTFGCGKISRLAMPVELLVSDHVMLRYSSPEFAEALADAPGIKEDGDLAKLAADDKAARNRLAEVERGFSSGQLGFEEMIRLKGMIDEARASIQAKMAKLETGRLVLTLPANGSLHEAWGKADLDTRRQLVALLVERVTLLPGRCGGSVWTHEPSGARFVFNPQSVRITWRV
jgi:DNA invertase Pin-like site-specific DNA recombinase